MSAAQSALSASTSFASSDTHPAEFPAGGRICGGGDSVGNQFEHNSASSTLWSENTAASARSTSAHFDISQDLELSDDSDSDDGEKNYPPVQSKGHDDNHYDQFTAATAAKTEAPSKIGDTLNLSEDDDEEVQMLLENEMAASQSSKDSRSRNMSVDCESIASGRRSTDISDSDVPPESKADDFLYCEECNDWIENRCLEHNIDFIENSNHSNGLPDVLEQVGGRIVAKQALARGVLFGPLSANQQTAKSGTSMRDIPYLWEVDLYTGQSRFFVAGSKHSAAGNWLCSVRTTCDTTAHEQNVIGIQFKSLVYYKTTRAVAVGEELKVCRGQGLPLTKLIPFNTVVTSKKGVCKFKCVDCPAQFAKENSLQAHRQSGRHSFIAKDKSYICELCAFSSMSQRALTLHMTNKHETKTSFACDVCGKLFSMRHHLQRHTATHQTEVHKCTQCNCSFRHAHSLALHSERVHKLVIKEAAFKCTYEACGKAYHSAEQLTSHMQGHRKDRKEKVREAVLENNKAKKLKRMEAEADRMLLGLDTAEQKDTVMASPANDHTQDADEQNLVTLLDTDDAESGFQCRYCENVYSKPQSRTRHEYKKHAEDKQVDELQRQITQPDRPSSTHSFVCVVCEKAFKKKGDLTIHEKRHAADKPYKCAVEGCACAYINKAELTKHQKRVHPHLFIKTVIID